MSFSYDPIQGDASVGTIVLSSEVEFSINIVFDKIFSWSVGGSLYKDLSSSWNIGDGEYHWYRIEGECRQVNCENFNVNYENCGSMTFMTVVPGRNLAEVCENLQSPRINAPVNIRVISIQRYSRPILKVNIIDDECNFLEDQYFCQIPECSDYCVDYEGFVSFELIAKPIEANYIFESSGGVNIQGRANTNNYFSYEPDSYLVLSGSCVLSLNLDFYSTSGVSILGRSQRTSSHYQHESTGIQSLELSGISRVIAPNRIHDSVGFLNLAGSGFILPIVSYPISISGTANSLISKVFEPSGQISIEGNLFSHKSSSYFYATTGFVNLTSDFLFNFKFLGTFESESHLVVKCLDLRSDLNGVQTGPDLTIDDSVINPSCGCGPMALSLVVRHNLINSSVFSNFLNRNGLSDDGIITLKYKTFENAWHGIKHFRGITASGGGVEDWSLMFILSCDSDFWRLSFLSTSENQQNKQNLQTKFIMDMPSELVCSDNNISTNIKLDIKSGEFSVVRGRQIQASERKITKPISEFARRVNASVDGIFNDYVVYYDNLGLFKNSYWSNVPFEIDINPSSKLSMQKINLQSIFQ